MVLIVAFAVFILVLVTLAVVREGPSFGWKTIAFWDTSGDAEEVERLRERSVELEETFAARVFVGPPTEQDLAPLVQAIALHREYIQRSKVNDTRNQTRLRELETKLSEARALGIHEQGRRAESLARERLAAGEIDEAVQLLTEAAEAQRRVNSMTTGDLRNIARVSILTRQIDDLRARTFVEQSAAAEAEARAFAAEERWTEALERFRVALALQNRINREFPNSGAVNNVRLQTLEVEIASFSTGGLIQEIQQLREAADAAMAAGRDTEAAAQYRAALQRQLEINNNFAQSRFASRERAERLRVQAENAESAQTARAVLARLADLEAALRERRLPAAQQLAGEVARQLDAFQVQFRRSTQIDEATRFRIAYFNEVRARFTDIQQGILDNTVPLAAGTALLRTEVPQALFDAVMRTNPSRIQGPTLPVESVSWEEAVEFCRRVAWVTGRTVRLPTPEEFRAAVGEVSPANATALGAWLADSTDQTTQPVGTSKPNALGAFDLLGNVSEWLLPVQAEGTTADYAGGSYVDRPGTFRQLPTGTLARAERSRTIGFRVVVTD